MDTAQDVMQMKFERKWWRPCGFRQCDFVVVNKYNTIDSSKKSLVSVEHNAENISLSSDEEYAMVT